MKNLKINEIERNTPSSREMREVKGGKTCDCGCHYELQEGSNAVDNAYANYDAGKNSSEPICIRVVDGFCEYIDDVKIHP